MSIFREEVNGCKVRSPNLLRKIHSKFGVLIYCVKYTVNPRPDSTWVLSLNYIQLSELSLWLDPSKVVRVLKGFPTNTLVNEMKCQHLIVNNTGSCSRLNKSAVGITPYYGGGAHPDIHAF